MVTEAEANGRVFEVGAVYVATPALKGQPLRLAAVLDVDRGIVHVAFVDEVAVGKVCQFDDRSMALLDTATGRYNIFSLVRAAAKEAAEVNEMKCWQMLYDALVKVHDIADLACHEAQDIKIN